MIELLPWQPTDFGFFGGGFLLGFFPLQLNTSVYLVNQYIQSLEPNKCPQHQAGRTQEV